MSTPLFRIVQLSKEHNRSIRQAFSCGSVELDEYFKKRVTQDIRKDVAKCYVAEAEAHRVVGYYTLSAFSLRLCDLPQEQQKRLPKYAKVPAACLGRLAVASEYQGKGLGVALLADAFAKCFESTLAVHALVVEPKDETAKQFYLHHEFLHLRDSRTLFLPIKTARGL